MSRSNRDRVRGRRSDTSNRWTRSSTQQTRLCSAAVAWTGRSIAGGRPGDPGRVPPFLGGCDTGDAKATTGGRLPARAGGGSMPSARCARGGSIAPARARRVAWGSLVRPVSVARRSSAAQRRREAPMPSRLPRRSDRRGGCYSAIRRTTSPAAPWAIGAGVALVRHPSCVRDPATSFRDSRRARRGRLFERAACALADVVRVELRDASSSTRRSSRTRERPRCRASS